MSLALTICLAVLAGLALLALLYSHWPSWLKLALCVGVVVFHFYADHTVHELSGWPTEDALPERFSLLAVVVEEPNAKTAGALYLWVNAIEGGKPVALPRAYRLPYAKDLHAVLNEGMKKARQGVSQMGTATPKKGKRGLAWLRPGRDEQEIKIRDLPAPQLPEK
ncbi:hypothetical protein [Pseudaquabacterium rugosum]|jgi:hypothetical protein|uniref:Uncharacterized protein n=1 Tax=Pseudaquabacterium rugosum TaxID=2984194 RepID=A0ABU9B6D8_9BURK